MTGLQAIADRVEIETLRGEFTDAAMMRDRARLASLFTPGGVTTSRHRRSQVSPPGQSPPVPAPRRLGWNG